MSFFGRFKFVKDGGKTAGPPSAREVAGRAYALNAVIFFGKTLGGSGVMPSQLGSMPAESAKPIEDTAARISKHVAGAAKKFGFLNDFSPLEALTIATPFRKLDDQMIVNATWRMEALQAILWSLQQVEKIPPYDEQAGDELFKILQLEQFESFAASAKLRPFDELESARSLAELWHWRGRTRQLIERGEPFPEMPKFKCFDDIVRFTAKATKERGDLPETFDEDFLAKGKAYRDLTDKEWSEVGSITAERHFALNWVCGLAPGNRWDETPTGT